MQKQAPTLGRLFVMVAFALSCFGLLLFLWLAFGGSIPLAPRGWRFEAQFNEATQLAKQADVRISGVSVGKVSDIQLARDGRFVEGAHAGRTGLEPRARSRKCPLRGAPGAVHCAREIHPHRAPRGRHRRAVSGARARHCQR